MADTQVETQTEAMTLEAPVYSAKGKKGASRTLA